MQISYYGYPKGKSYLEYIMQLSATIQAPPHYTWIIDGCDTGLQVTPGQWYHMTMRWDKMTLTLFINGNLCRVANLTISPVIAAPEHHLSTRRTPFVFLNEQGVEDFIFNDEISYPLFFHLDYLANSRGEVKGTAFHNLGDFYASFRLIYSKTQTTVSLPGLDVIMRRVNGKLIVDSEQKCSVFSLPPACATNTSCGVEVERQGSNIIAYSQNLPLAIMDDSSLCGMTRQQISQPGLVSNSQVRLFNRGRSELLKRRLILTRECAHSHDFTWGGNFKFWPLKPLHRKKFQRLFNLTL